MGRNREGRGVRERPLFQLGLSLFLIIYTASIPRRLPRYVRRGVFEPTGICLGESPSSFTFVGMVAQVFMEWLKCSVAELPVTRKSAQAYLV